MWHINILNHKRYEETGDYLVVTFRMSDYFNEILDQLETNDIRDLKIVSYDLPFPLKCNGYETLLNLSERHSLLQRLSEMEGTQYGLRFKELCSHFCGHNIENYIHSHEHIKWLAIANYEQLLNELIKADYISYRFVVRFFDFKRFFKVNTQYDFEIAKDLNVDLLSLIYSKVKSGEYMEYLKQDEVFVYLKDVLNVLETEVGFFVTDHTLHLLENDEFTLDIYTEELLAKMVKEKWFDGQIKESVDEEKVA